MELGTFGAILGFAIKLEERGADFYDKVAQRGLGELFVQRAGQCRRRAMRLERARRESVVEMILEAIHGLESEDYLVRLDFEGDGAHVERCAADLEDATIRFYRDAAAKMPIREIVRLFGRLRDQHQSYLAAGQSGG